MTNFHLIVSVLKAKNLEAEADTECRLALKSVQLFVWPYPSCKYKEKFLPETTKVCQVNRPLPKKEIH